MPPYPKNNNYACFTELCLTKLAPYLMANSTIPYLLKKVIGKGCSCIYGICTYNCHGLLIFAKYILGQAKLIISFPFQGFQNSMRAGGHFT